jgi:hypothetical protein
MNCECVSNLEKQLIGTQHKQRQINKVTWLSKAFVIHGNKLNMVTNSELELELEGMKRPVILCVNHNFCPICGDKIDKSDSEIDVAPSNGSADASEN